MSAVAPDKRRLKALSVALALLLAAFSFGLEYHHHDDGDVHPDCSFCVALHHAQSASLQHQETGPAGVVCAHLVPPAGQTVPRSLHLEVPVIRPPPASVPA